MVMDAEVYTARQRKRIAKRIARRVLREVAVACLMWYAYDLGTVFKMGLDYDQRRLKAHMEDDS